MMTSRFLMFLLINFGALWIGRILSGKGAASEWYQSLTIAPWTPPGWLFGAAWFSIMLFFSVYMAKAVELVPAKRFLLVLFIIQFFLNVLWNPLFFRWHFILFALITIVFLTFLVGYLLFRFNYDLKLYSFFLLPYFIWLCLAISLNAYILFKN